MGTIILISELSGRSHEIRKGGIHTQAVCSVSQVSPLACCACSVFARRHSPWLSLVAHATSAMSWRTDSYGPMGRSTLTHRAELGCPSLRCMSLQRGEAVLRLPQSSDTSRPAWSHPCHILPRLRGLGMARVAARATMLGPAQCRAACMCTCGALWVQVVCTRGAGGGTRGPSPSLTASPFLFRWGHWWLCLVATLSLCLSPWKLSGQSRKGGHCLPCPGQGWGWAPLQPTLPSRPSHSRGASHSKKMPWRRAGHNEQHFVFFFLGGRGVILICSQSFPSLV